jgi:hypothetical protein
VKLEGTLNTIPLRELIDMIAYSSVTGVLNLYAEQSVGHLYFRDGHLYHCDFNSAAGVEALAGMLEVIQADFSFIGDVVSEQESLWGDMGYHVQMAERLAYRWQGVRAAIPSLDLVPILLVPFETALRRVGPSHHQVLDRIDGNHSLKAIVVDLGWAEIDLAEAIMQMLQDNLIELRHGAQLSLPVAQTLDPPRNGLFDRLRPRQGAGTHQQVTERSRLVSPDEMVLNILRS